MKSLLIFVAVCLILQTVQCVATGRISISYKDEDPTTGATVDQILQIGESIQANITLSPAPQIPLRFDVVSTMPDVITVSHDVITFNRGQTTGVITLESPSDGKIGVATIIISPQKAGYYIPVTTTILVTGTLSIGLSEDTCVSVNRTTEFTVTISSPAPEGIPLNITASNGVLSTNATEIITGTSSVTFSFTGTTVGSTVITVTSLLFGNATLTFPTQGSIEATNVPTRFLQGAPETILINVNPPASPNNPPVIATRSSNVIVTPTTFVVNPSVNNGSRTVEIIPVNPGFGSVTFASPGYCPLTLDFPVNVSPLCSAGFVPNINADECVVCPGNEQNDGFYFELNTCNNRGTCQYSRCFDNAAVCFCEFPYEGHSCQFNPETDSEIYTSGVLNNETLVLSLEGFAAASGPVNFTAPGNLVRNETGRAFVARYSPEEPFFGAVNPALSPPGNGTFSGISWYWENVCEDNTLIPANFTAAVEVNFPIRPDLLSTITNIQNFYSGIRLYVHRNNTWVPVNQLCAANGINTRVFADLTNFELEASFCQSGQFALFLVPVTPPVPNTGNTNPRNPDADLLPESAGTGKTGFVIPPPKPLPVLPQTVYNASPLNKHLFNDAGSLRASIVALLVAVVVAIIV